MKFLHRRAESLSQSQCAAMSLDALLRCHPQIIFEQRHVAAVGFGGFPSIGGTVSAQRFHRGECSVQGKGRQAERLAETTETLRQAQGDRRTERVW